MDDYMNLIVLVDSFDAWILFELEYVAIRVKMVGSLSRHFVVLGIVSKPQHSKDSSLCVSLYESCCKRKEFLLLVKR